MTKLKTDASRVLFTGPPDDMARPVPILRVPSTKLRERSDPVEEGFEGLRKLIRMMLSTMYDAKGIGLSAIQIGVPLRVITVDFTFYPKEKLEDMKPIVLINPTIFHKSVEMRSNPEGCLSVPNIFYEVPRHEMVRVKYFDENWIEREQAWFGWHAGCIQHEMDHLEGIVFIDHLSKIKQDRALKKVEKGAKR